MSEEKKKVLDFYTERESVKGHSVDLASDHNTHAINCCEKWRLADISLDEFKRLVIVACPESKPLLIDGRLLLSVAAETKNQLTNKWQSGWNDIYIKKLIANLHDNLNALVNDPLILRTKLSDEPLDGSYYVQDGNHRILAAGVFFLETGIMPDLVFYIGVVDENCFRK